ncbi:MAG: iron-sulfur cluster assembly accessory protein [Candidatus Calescibacterium sp.]|nr:iron-sulfur cluster assembly accessory protein [Candidatus Calescibacterium sp.]MCX7971642.1 iron-sulfur cluster assembly accessory protein [bacterium]MDW8195850.1 iron-sulfur cluster assembly accessory protein [Candidatus Calescibacterium sp.]
MICLTEKAKEKIKQMIIEEGGGYYLRIYAIPSGCCGLDFGIELTKEIESTDILIDAEDFKVVIDDFSYPFLKDISIDVVEKEGEIFFVLNSKEADFYSSSGCCCCSSIDENQNHNHKKGNCNCKCQ